MTEMWYDIDSDSHYLIRNGLIIPCTALGQEKKQFNPYYTGLPKSRGRNSHAKKTVRNIALKSIRRDNSLLSSPDSLPSKLSNRLPSLFLPRNHNSLLINSKSKLKTISDPSNADLYIKETNLKKRINNSQLSIKHMPLLKKTFKWRFTSLNGCSENTLRLLSRKSEQDEDHKQYRIRSYSEMRNKMRRELDGVAREGEETSVKKCLTRGIYGLRVPSETELYFNAREVKKRINPKVFEYIRKQEEIDMKMVKNRRKQLIQKLLAIRGKAHNTVPLN
eukprot:TRINITY_DN5768_c0_g1_i2.p1 TRINITY_DN5768_c0_g1~~TRINITY_DN5768_c0_g1_i2.p1  ORF type:complete len:277 (-),score=47.24 TRINITY_DN5768_c0_g1_i2:132-962(-)